MTDRHRQRQFETLLQERRGIVFKVARAYARGSADRDDLAQEIAVQLWRSFGHYDAARAKFSTWMYRVALNVAISHAVGPIAGNPWSRSMPRIWNCPAKRTWRSRTSGWRRSMPSSGSSIRSIAR